MAMQRCSDAQHHAAKATSGSMVEALIKAGAYLSARTEKLHTVESRSASKVKMKNAY
jgi:hypothetical protein